ncbi:MAG: YtxH domain-containing protein [Paludibacteraceae bacterium]|nr:YtxH domain-containing protein [Paludibacteraceae bacterium]
MGNGKFFEGVLVGAALAWAGNYFLNTEKGKETCKKVKDGLEKFRDELESEFNKFTQNIGANSEPKGDSNVTE